MVEQPNNIGGGSEKSQLHWRKVPLNELKSPLASDGNDQVLLFKISDWFPSEDPLALMVLQFLCAWEDLSTIDRLKEVLDQARSQVHDDEIGAARWQRGHFLLLRVRLGILRNVYIDLIDGWSQKYPSQASLLSSLGSDVQTNYETLLRIRTEHRHLFTVMEKFRSNTLFHYDVRAISKTLQQMKNQEGQIIVNSRLQEIDFIAATPLLDIVPTGQISKEEVMEIRSLVDIAQSHFRAFVYQLLSEYMKHRNLIDTMRLKP